MILANIYRRYQLPIITLFSVCCFGVASVFAVPPTSSYNPGQTLDPSCLPGSTNCTVTTLYPSQTGNAGKYLTTDGTSVSWASVAGGLGGSGTTNAIPKFTGSTTLGDSGISDSGTTVTIGNSFSPRLLSVAVSNTNSYVDPSNYSGMLVGNNASTLSQGVGIRLFNNVTGGAESGIISVATASDTSNLGFYTEDGGNGRGYRLFIDHQGYVGLGTTTPTQVLDVRGNVTLGTDNKLFFNHSASGEHPAIDFVSNLNTGSRISANGSWDQGIIVDLDYNSQSNFDNFLIRANGNASRFAVDSTGFVGVATASPTSLFSVGSSSQFQVDTSGNIVKLNNVTTSFPASQGSAGSMLVNNGSGTLSWSTTLGDIMQSPTTSTAITTPPTVTGAFQSVVVGHIAYVAQSSNGTFAVVDLRNINAPTVLTTVTPPGSSGVYWLKVAGDYLYVISGTNFTIYDIKTPTSPVQLSTTAGGSFLFSIDVQGKYAYVLDNGAGTMKIYDITNPASPALMSTLTTVGGNSYQVAVSGRYAYVANNGSAFSIVDISNPASPSIVTTLSGFNVRAVTVSGSLLLTTGTNGDRYYDITNPTSPVKVEDLNNSGYKIAVGGRYASYGNKIFDITDPTTPVAVNSSVSSGACSIPTFYGKYILCPQSNQLQIYSTVGIDTFGITAGNVTAGQANVIHDLDVGGHLFVTNGIATGQSGAFIGGALGVKGDATFNGKIGIGTTAPGYTLDVEQTTSGVVSHFVNASGYCDINPTTTSLVCSSDVRLKKNITSLDDVLSRVNRLRGVLYNWNSETDGDQKHYGFVAQELETVFPEVVATDQNGYKSVAYSALTPILAEAIKELDLKITNISTTHGVTIQDVTDYLASTTNTIVTIITNVLHAHRVETDEVCVGDRCISAEEFNHLLDATNTTYTPRAGVTNVSTPPASGDTAVVSDIPPADQTTSSSTETDQTNQ